MVQAVTPNFINGDRVVQQEGSSGVVTQSENLDGHVLVMWDEPRAYESWVASEWLRIDLYYGSSINRKKETVTKPAHYDLPGGIQVIDLIRDESFLRGNLIKYVFRAPHKGNELEDMEKAAEYLKWELERLRALG